jgi:lipoyl(octanoyl) transferase
MIARPESAANSRCEARWLGTVPYARGVARQDELVQRRRAGEIPDQLLLLEHPHVLTLGRDAHAENILANDERLRALGVEVHEVGRGGDVTYHGPGQLVAYPIIDLAPDRCDLHRYVRDLEEVLLGVLADYDITGHVVPGKTGVWVGDAKVGAIGVRVARWITSHGIALNVRPDLGFFDLIVPCGLRDSKVTSLALLTGRDDLQVQDVGTHFAAHFGRVFDRRMDEVAS